MRLLSAVVTAAALTVSASAFAGDHRGPTGFSPDTVAGVLRNGMDDQMVTLKGRLTEYLGYDRYRFTDETGSIEVELDDDRDWSFISKNELIQISGKLDDDFLSTKIDVKYVVSLESGMNQVFGPRMQ